MIRKETNVNRIAILLLTIVRMLLGTARSMLRSFFVNTRIGGGGVGERVGERNEENKFMGWALRERFE